MQSSLFSLFFSDLLGSLLAEPPSVVEAANERPDPFDGPSEELAQVGQDYETQGDADEGVEHGHYTPDVSCWRNVPIPCKETTRVNISE